MISITWRSRRQSRNHSLTSTNQPWHIGKQRARLTYRTSTAASTSQGVALPARGSNESRAGVQKLWKLNLIRGIVECRYWLSQTLSSPLLPCVAKCYESFGGRRMVGTILCAEVIGECRVHALQQLEVADQSELYTCGMQYLKQLILLWRACYSREGLLCSYPMEVGYYIHKKQKASWYHPEFCTYCARVNDIWYVD